MGFESVGSGAMPEASKKNTSAPDLSRRKFLSFGGSDTRVENTNLEKKRGEEVARLENSDVSAGTNQPEDITRRDALKMLAVGATIGTGINGVTKVVSRINDAGGIEGIGKKAKRIKDGVTDGRLARYVAERQEESANKEWLESRLDYLKKSFEKRYRISLVFDDNPHFYRKDRGRISSKEANLKSKVEAATLLLDQFQLYPTFMIEGLHIPSVNVRSVLMNGSDGEVNGFAVSDDHSIALSVQDDIMTEVQFGKQYGAMTHTIHHELFHLFDPLCGEKTTDSSSVEQRWQGINQAKDLVYSNDEWKTADGTFRPTGFARTYGTRNILEDRATIFEELMAGRFSPETLEEDDVLKEKIDTIYQEMFMLSRGAMGKIFFRQFLRLGKDVDWAEKIVKNSREIMMEEEPLFEEVSDETYRDWQRFHREKTIPDYYRKRKELAE